MSVPRKLAAILAADVAGYSRLTGLDEEGTLERLRNLRRELINPAVSLYRGRVVKTTGDGILIEFPSVVDALRCALDVQRGMDDRNTDVPTEKRIAFRVGINVGDVVVEGEDLLGDSVKCCRTSGRDRRTRRHLHLRERLSAGSRQGGREVPGRR